MTPIPLEKHLEKWIETDPSLVYEGLTIVGRQVRVEGRKNIIDLLAIDEHGKWCIIETKRQKVDDKTVGQAIRYAAWLRKAPRDELEEKINDYLQKTAHHSFWHLCKEKRWNQNEVLNTRDIMIYVVGTQQSSGLEESMGLIESSGIKAKIITLQLFQDDNGRQTLVRDAHDTASVPTKIEFEPLISEIEEILEEDLPQETNISHGAGQRISPDSLIALAHANGIGQEFHLLFDTATKYGLYPRTYKHSIMYTPPQNKTRVLFCVWVWPSRHNKQSISVYVNPLAFAEFFPISEAKAIYYLGQKGGYVMALPRVETFVEGLDRLFAEIKNA